MMQYIWTCDHCGVTAETEGDWLPDGWIEDVTESPYKSYHSRECMFETMTKENIDAFKEGVWMA